MNEIQQLLAHLNMNQKTLCKSLGYTPQYISNLVNGRMPVTDSFIGRVIAKHGIDSAKILLIDKPLPAHQERT